MAKRQVRVKLLEKTIAATLYTIIFEGEDERRKLIKIEETEITGIDDATFDI